MSSMQETAPIAVLVAFGLLISGGAVLMAQTQASEWDMDGMLPTFRDQQQMQRYIQGTQFNGAWQGNGAEATAGADSMTATPRHSRTNIQVEGVDEADIVKTDGELICVASYDTISILKAYPPQQLYNVSSVNVRDALGLADNYSACIQGLYLLQGRIAAVISVSGPYDQVYPMAGDGREIAYSIWPNPEGRTVIAVFSLNQQGPPTLVKQAGASGYGITSRMTGNVVYLVTQQYLWLNGGAVPAPKEWQGNGSTCLPATSVRFDPGCEDPSSFLNLLAMDMSTLESELTSIVTGYASAVYVSTEAMYLTFQKWSGTGGAVIAMEASGDSAVAVSSDPACTTIYKIALDGTNMVPQARRDVPGHLLNQFSLDEKDGHLRVATTKSWQDPRNAVYVLGANLTVVGCVEDLAPGERIYSCRFMGDTLYMVTFRQVDPLFVIDLSDPTSPAVVGELKVPGFSSYLHPLGEGRLLGIGMENGSVKVSLFDVSDPTAPAELGTVLVPGFSFSDALYDHKAVTYDETTGSLVIPVSSYDRECWRCTSGAYVFAVGDEHVALKGVIQPREGEYVMRAQYIGDYLYTVSDSTVYVNSLLDLSSVGHLVYKQNCPDYLPLLIADGSVVTIEAAA